VKAPGRQGAFVGAALRAAYVAAGAAVGALAFLRRPSGEEAAEKWRQRRGIWPARRDSRPWVWIQASSVGEADLALALASALGRQRPDLAWLVSSMTDTGRARVRSESSVESRYFPIDYAPFLRRILDHGPPRLFVSVETEVWPETFRVLADLGVPVAIANARLSDASVPRYRRLAPWLAPLLARVSAVAARDEEAARRWVAIGARPGAVTVTGNLKFDLAIPAEGAENSSLFAVDASRRLLLAASTHEGEEALALAAFEEVRRERSELGLVLAPRHPERAEAVVEAVRSRGLACANWSELGGASPPPRIWPPAADVVVLDRLGLLRSAYASASAAFVGGSAVEGPGGHNLLEAVAALCPVAAGPHLGNVADQASLLREAGALEVVHNPTDLMQFWLQALVSPEEKKLRSQAALALLRSRLGALDRTVAFLLPLLDGDGGGRGR
jgi:3-deoxy-D-manno-octulosonic-acid transferase